MRLYALSRHATVVPILVDALKLEKTQQVKQQIIKAISRFGNDAKAAIPILEDIVNVEKDNSTRLVALNAIPKIDKNNRLFIPDMVDILKNS